MEGRAAIRLLLASTWLVALALIERRFPLRRGRTSSLVRWTRNATLAALSIAIIAAFQSPALDAVARRLAEQGWSARSLHGSLRAAELVLGFLFLDYTLWIWHRLNHEVPFLWRFHLVHHVDRDLDASTGVRFHFGEIGLSIGFRALQLAFIGGDLELLGAWQSALFASILFHHSNVRLPARLDRSLAVLIVTPRMHGIHHSHVREETDSNWSSLLTIWDRLHGTLRLDVPQDDVTIGVPAWDDERDVSLARIVAMPFREQRADWTPRAGAPRTTEAPAKAPPRMGGNPTGRAP